MWLALENKYALLMIIMVGLLCCTSLILSYGLQWLTSNCEKCIYRWLGTPVSVLNIFHCFGVLFLLVANGAFDCLWVLDHLACIVALKQTIMIKSEPVSLVVVASWLVCLTSQVGSIYLSLPLPEIMYNIL